MMLKCIGGPSDGEYHEVYERRYGDIIAIVKHENTKIVTYDLNAIPEITKTNFCYYKIEKVGWLQDGKHLEWIFLLYEKLTIPEMFAKLFT